MRKPPPDFVIVGAPKCGTTAVYETLRRHPGIFLPGLKEPQYFAFDHKRGRPVEKLDVYDLLYTEAAGSQLRGDASILYLSSSCAVPAILERRPDAKFIALIRDPVEMFVSWHNECLKSLDEDEKDPERAWRLQDERAAGRVPKLCKEPVYLQYRQICSVGSQCQRMFDLVPESQRLVILLDDLNRNSSIVYKQIIEFLGLATLGMSEFSRENTFASHTNPLAARMIRLFYVSPVLKDLRLRLKPYLNKKGIYPLKWVVSSSLRTVPKPILSERFERELREEFRADILLTEKLLGRSLLAWRGAAGKSGEHTSRSHVSA